jgi:hypothetical protein
MNGRDIRALGWVVTIDVWGQIVRASLGRPARIARGDLLALRQRWLVLRNIVRADEERSLNTWLGGPIATALSPKSEAAVEDFVERLTVACPALYGERALRTRCLNQLTQVAAFGVLGTLLASYASAGSSTGGDATLMAFAAAGLSLVTTLHLRRTYVLVKRLSLKQSSPDLLALEKRRLHTLRDRTTRD